MQTGENLKMFKFTLAIIPFLFIPLLSFIIGVICWPYTINTWLIFLGKEAVITWWTGGLLGLVPFFGKWSSIACVATWIIMLFM